METQYEILGGAREGLRATYSLSDLVIDSQSPMATGRMPRPTMVGVEKVKFVRTPIQPYRLNSQNQTPNKSGEKQ